MSKLFLSMLIVIIPTYANAVCGLASKYGREGGRITANGHINNPRVMHAAHKTLPLGSRIRVTNQRTGNSVIVIIDDRGPYVAGRILDLSNAAASAIRMDGLAHVCYEQIGKTDEKNYFQINFG